MYDASVELELSKQYDMIDGFRQPVRFAETFPVAGGLRRTPAKQAGASLFARRPGWVFLGVESRPESVVLKSRICLDRWVTPLGGPPIEEHICELAMQVERDIFVHWRPVLFFLRKWAHIFIRVFPKIGVPQNRWFIRENPIKLDDLDVPLYLETSTFPKIPPAKNWGSPRHHRCSRPAVPPENRSVEPTNEKS